MRLMNEDRAWAGSEASLQTVLDAQEAIAARMAAGLRDNDDDEDEEDPRLLQVQDGVAVVSIKGSLVNSDSYYNRFINVSGYPEIREAMVAAATDPEVKQIMLDIDSGGGSVAGVSDTASLIRMINDKVKPVTAFSGGSVYSAAYWLASSAGEVYADKMAGVGSIGVIATHMERSKALAEEGIGVNVIRAGKYKALANSVEPLSEEGRKQIQAHVDAAYKVFVGHIAEMRGKTYDYADQTMAQGQEFVASDAMNVGLIDGVTTFDALLSDLKDKSEKPMDKSKSFMQNRGNAGHTYAQSNAVEHGDSEMRRKKTGLTEQEVAALAAGAALEATVSETEAEANVEDTTVEAAAEEDVQAEAVAPEGADPVAEVAKNDNALGLLKEQLKAAQDDLLEAKIDARKAGEKLAEIEATVNPLAAIVAKAINNMQVALGGSALDLSGLAPAALLAEHDKMVEQFQSKFKVGGVAAVDAANDVKKNEQKVDALTQARFNAVRFSK